MTTRDNLNENPDDNPNDNSVGNPDDNPDDVPTSLRSFNFRWQPSWQPNLHDNMDDNQDENNNPPADSPDENPVDNNLRRQSKWENNCDYVDDIVTWKQVTTSKLSYRVVVSWYCHPPCHLGCPFFIYFWILSCRLGFPLDLSPGLSSGCPIGLYCSHHVLFSRLSSGLISGFSGWLPCGVFFGIVICDDARSLDFIYLFTANLHPSVGDLL
jgi:hypothetical protein